MAETARAARDDASRFLTVGFADRTAVYDRRSGRTSMLDPLTGAVLEALCAESAPMPSAVRGESADLAALQQAVATRLGVPAGDIDEGALSSALARLRSAGLVRL